MYFLNIDRRVGVAQLEDDGHAVAAFLRERTNRCSGVG